MHRLGDRMTAECASILKTLHEVAGETTQWQIVQPIAQPWRGVRFALAFEIIAALAVWIVRLCL